MSSFFANRYLYLFFCLQVRFPSLQINIFTSFFSCRPEVVVSEPRVHAVSGANATLQCRILGNPPPAVKWVLNGRVIKNRSAPLAAKSGQLYLIQSVATREGL